MANTFWGRATAATASAALAVPAILIGAASPAAAATTKCIYEGNDRVCGTEHSSTYSTIQVCDNETDGNGVYGILIGHSGEDVRVGDGNGSSTGCGSGSLNDTIFIIRICEDDLGNDTCVSEYFDDI